MLGLNFGELFIVCFVLIAVIASPYAGRTAEFLAQCLGFERATDGGAKTNHLDLEDTGDESPPSDGGKGA